MYFRLRDNIHVEEIFSSLPIFHPDVMTTIIEYNGADAATITERMKWNGTTFDPEFTLIELKDRRKDEVNNNRDSAINLGVVYNTNTYDSDLKSQQILTSLIAGFDAGITIPVGFTYRTKDNQDISFDLAGLIALGDVMINHINTTYNTSWTHKASVDAAVDADAVNALDLTI